MSYAIVFINCFNQEFCVGKYCKMLVEVGGGRWVNNTNCFH